MHRHQFGTLVDWEEKAAHQGNTIGFPRAKLVLEAQAYLLEVLCSITEKILVGVDPSQPPRIEKWRNLTTHEAFREMGVVEFWSPYPNQAFSRPPRFDINYLITLAKTRLDETGDHLWYLQTDAAYTRRHLKIMCAADVFKKASDAEKAMLVARQVRVEIHSHHWWRWIEMECKHLEAERQRFRDNIHPGQPLPTTYDKALGALELLLVNMVIYRASLLKELLPRVPGLQKYWSVELDANIPDEIGWVKRESLTNTQGNLSEDPLDWILVQLLGAPDDQRTFDHAMLFAMLQDHLSSNPPERKRLDENTYQTPSDLSTCHEMLVAVRFHRPQSLARSLDEVRATEHREPWNPRISEDYKSESAVFHKVGASFLKDFYNQKIPSGPKNAEWLARSRVLRSAMETFWKSMREIVSKELGSNYFSQEHIDRLLEPISANLSREYLQQEQLAETEILAAIQGVQDQLSAINFFHEAEPRTASSKTITHQEKVKKRGQEIRRDATEPRIDEAGIHEEPTEPIKATAIEVSQQSLGVFQIMFPNKDDTAMDILWDRFIHAMCDAGFVARTNSGSAVAFTQVSGQAGRIVFHKPHPVDRIDPVLLRIMAKRMARWFGWRRELFVLRTEGI